MNRLDEIRQRNRRTQEHRAVAGFFGEPEEMRNAADVNVFSERSGDGERLVIWAVIQTKVLSRA